MLKERKLQSFIPFRGIMANKNNLYRPPLYQTPDKESLS
jgi:hypothetical protein